MVVFYILLILVPVIWIWITFRRKRPLADMPGPKRDWIFGNLFQLNTTRTYLQLTAWAQQYGPVFSLDMFGNAVVVVSGREALYEMLVKRGKDFAGRDSGGFRMNYTSIDSRCLVAADPSPTWHKQKKIMMQHVKAYGPGFKHIEKIVGTEMETFISQLYAICADGKETIQFDDYIRKLVFSISSIIMFGHDIDAKEKALFDERMKMFIEANTFGLLGKLLDTFPFLRFFGHPYWNYMQRVNEINDILYSGWKERVYSDRKIGKDMSTNILNTILEIKEGRNEIGFIEEDCMALIIQIFAAAISTTSNTLNTLMSNLIMNPEVQERLYEESKRCLGRGKVTIEHRASMPYHQAVILEILRMCPVLPLMVPHKALIDTSIASYHIPAGCMVFPNIWALHHDDKVWDKPLCFIPKRFLDDKSQLVPADHPARSNLLAFGAGPRVCAGETMAMARMFMILATVIQHFELLPATTLEEQPMCGCMDLLDGFALSPRPYSVKVKPREDF